MGSRNVFSLRNRATNIFALTSSAESQSNTRLYSAPAAAYNQSVDVFPSIVIGADGLLSARGPFAEAQAQVSHFRFYHSYLS